MAETTTMKHDEQDLHTEIEEMISNTSCLALGNIIVRRNPIRKCLWCMGFIICTLLTIIQLYSLSVTYFSYPLNTVITIRSQPVDFPRITVCNLNPIRRSQLHLASPALQKFLTDLGTRNYTADNKNEFKSRLENEEQFQQLFQQEPRDVRLKMGSNLTDLVLQCSFLGVKCDLDKLFSPIVSNKYGNCYMFDPYSFYSANLTQKKLPRSKSLFLTFYVQTQEYLPNLIPSSGVRIHFHERGSIELPEKYGYNLPPGFEVSLGVTPTIVRKLNEIEGNCEDGKEFRRKYKSTYTRENCVYVCLQEIVNRRCKCYESTFYPYNSTIQNFCHTKAEIQCISTVMDEIDDVDKVCTCPTSCNVTTYSVRQSYAKWPTHTYEVKFFNDLRDVYPKFNETDLFKFKDNGRKNLTNAVIYMMDDFYKEIDQKRSYQIDNYLSDIGGTLGLYLGFSVLTGFECLEIIMLLMKHAYRNIQASSDNEKKPLIN